jgi:hypothetical protein
MAFQSDKVTFWQSFRASRRFHDGLQFDTIHGDLARVFTTMTRLGPSNQIRKTEVSNELPEV